MEEHRVTVRLPVDIYRRVRSRAAWDGASGVAEWIRDLIRTETCPHPNPYEGVCGDCGRTGV